MSTQNVHRAPSPTTLAIWGVAFLLFASFLAPQVVRAQSRESAARITGAVRDSNGAAIRSAQVRLIGASNAETTTDDTGQFAFTQIALGVYEIDVLSKTLGLASRKNIVISGDEHVSIEYLASTVDGLRVIGSVSTSANAKFNVTPASIASVSPSQTALDGETPWRRILEQIPGVTAAKPGGGAYVNDDVVDGPQADVVLSINGALPYETATLIDGLPLEGRSFSSSAGAVMISGCCRSMASTTPTSCVGRVPTHRVSSTPLEEVSCFIPRAA